MQTIWKYPLEITDSQTVSMPRARQILTVQRQGEIVAMWAIVNPSVASEDVRVMCFGTGNGEPSSGDIYIGTIQAPPFVWHFFERRIESLSKERN